MPDLQTALSSALLKKEINEWDNEEKQRMNKTPAKKMPNRFQTSNNVMRITFDHVRDNPNLTTMEHAHMLVKKGFKENSVVSVLSQLVRAGQVQKDDERLLSVTCNEYQPIKQKARIRTKTKGNTHQSSAKAGIAALPKKAAAKPVEKTVEKREPASIVLTRNWSAQDVVDKLTVMQARSLYDLLKQIFGG
jgi:hypothetical protein